MEDLDGTVTSPAEWREKNRGLMLALSACLALWLFTIWLVIR
ncbi:MAG TPA: hypothetical protein VL993_00885 [Stellaceae bacterium]|nr:hypothetical protein [Stellaceae bacterium]